MKKIIIVIFFITICLGQLLAQDEEPGPKKGTVTVSLLLGKTSTYETGNWLLLPDEGESSYTVISPNLGNYPTMNSLINMIGAEGKWFFADKWAVRLNGAALINTSPSYNETKGVSSGNTASIPDYKGVPARENTELIINAGVDKYFATKNKNLFWYASPVAIFHYARKSGYEVSSSSTASSSGTTRYAEAWGIGLSGISGVEYYTKWGLVLGFEIHGISYMYTQNSIVPAEGLSPLRADNHSISFLSQPTVKIGFKF